MNQLLRTLLEEMTRNIGIDAHPARLEAIAKEVPHSIHLMPTPDNEQLANFNCVMHALNLIGLVDPPCSPIFGRFYADTAFIGFLIASNRLQPCPPESGAVVVWSSAGDIKHVGLVAEPGRATSKWGIGYIYEHALFEVPESYGDKLDFYGRLNAKNALTHLVEYCK